jgi:hypothetical protein
VVIDGIPGEMWQSDDMPTIRFERPTLPAHVAWVNAELPGKPTYASLQRCLAWFRAALPLFVNVCVRCARGQAFKHLAYGFVKCRIATWVEADQINMSRS